MLRLSLHTLILACLLIPFSMTLLGCDSDDGPVEKAGEKADEAANDLKRKAEDATD